jgi:hypothetical protein
MSSLSTALAFDRMGMHDCISEHIWYLGKCSRHNEIFDFHFRSVDLSSFFLHVIRFNQLSIADILIVRL